MTTPHGDLAEEFRVLARLALERMEPLLRGAEEQSSDTPWQGCTWCPLCAVAALVKGERHPLLGVVARESEHLLVLLREVLREHGANPPPPADPADRATGGAAHPEDHPGADRGADPDVGGRSGHRPVVEDIPVEFDVEAGAEADPSAPEPSYAAAGTGAMTYQPIDVTIDDAPGGR